MSGPVPLAAADVAVVAAFLLLAGLAVHHRDRPGAVVAALLWVALAATAAGLALGRTGVVSGRAAVGVVIAGWIAVVPLWAGFVFEHTGRGPSVNARWAALGAVYVAVTVAASLRGAGLGGAVGQFVRVGTSILQTSLIGVGLFGVFLLVRSTVAYDDLPRGQGVALSVGGLGTSLMLFSLTTVGAGDPATLPWTTTGFLGVVAAAFAVGVVPYRLFDATPGTGPLARASVLEEMSEAVLVVDRDGRLVDANEAAEQSLGVVVARDAGRPVAAVLGWDPATAAASTTTVPTPNGRRRLDASRSELTDRRGEPVGAAFVVQDVTDRRTREQRLEVLDRVLRHNLRNDLDAVRAFAEALAEEDVADPGAVAERIGRTSSGLVDLGATVDRAERTLTREALDVRPVDVEGVARDVADRVRERYDCRIDVAATGGAPEVATDRDVLQTALRELVENAVEHAADDVPTASIDVESTDGGVRVAVRDRGPGIPERERAVVLEGEETPLEHGSGVGLWLVSWAVTRLGGALSFADVEAGSRVVLEVPDRPGERVNGSR